MIRRRRPSADLPGPARVRRADGSAVPLELVYEGWADGAHRWRAVTVVKAREGDVFECDVLPAHCAVGLAVVRTFGPPDAP